MKKPLRPTLKASALSPAALAKVGGARGSFCGAVFHCFTCGAVGGVGCTGANLYSINLFCASCKRSINY